MVARKPLAPNNSRKSLNQLFHTSRAVQSMNVKSFESPSVVTYAGRGRQNSEGFGGGYRVGRRSL